jgi:RNA polymerase-binding transcription factor DksA
VDPDQVRERLEQERTRLLAVKETFADEHLADESESEAISELSSVDQHQADLGTETFEREKDLSILEQLEEELAELQAALERIDAGTYGIDEVTGDPIAPERLEAMPTARTNVDTEARREGSR